ncbi:MAG: TonB-dependent receptor [Bacteroidales bacterium]|jgi:iron complex outermembrane receptor protein|nr:TonB-dependent receptor [Bacteroidales bacterium]
MFRIFTWKKKDFFSHFNPFTIVIIVLLINVPTVFSQKDSLNPVRLEPVDLHWIRPSGEQPFAGTTVNKEEMDKNRGNGSINMLFENIPSMVTASDAGNGLGNTYMRIRGIDHTRINVTINGIELNDAESQGTWFVNMPNFSNYVQSMSMQRGVGTSTNGAAAFGASVNFTTLDDSPAKPFLEISSAAGSFYTFRNSVTAGSGLVKERFSVVASYSNLLSKGYLDRATANLNSGFVTTHLKLLGIYSQKNYGSLKFNMLYGKEKTGLAWNGTDPEMLATNRLFNSCGAYYDDEGRLHYYDNETDNYQQRHYQLFYNYSQAVHPSVKIHQLFDLNVGLHLTRGYGYYEQYKDDRRYSNYDLDPVVNEAGKELKKDLITQKDLDNYFYGFTVNLSDDIHNLERGSSIKWTVGGAVNYYDGQHFGDVIWTQIEGVFTNPHRWYVNTGKKLQANAYAKVEYNPIKKLLLYGDIQYRYIDFKVNGQDEDFRDITNHYVWSNFVNPKIGFNLYLDNKLRNSLYFSFAISHREPTRADIVDAAKERMPIAERLYDFELGYLLHFHQFAFNANAYFMYYQNQLVLTGELNDVGGSMMDNVDKSYRTGIELVASYRPSRFFLWKINGTFSMNKILNYVNYTIDYNSDDYVVEKLGTTHISFSPAIIAGNEFIVTPFRHFDINWKNKFVGKQYLDNTSNNNFILKPYLIGSLQFNYYFNIRKVADLSLFFLIDNLYNWKYSSNGSFYQYYEGTDLYQYDAYNPQAGINFMTGITVKF